MFYSEAEAYFGAKSTNLCEMDYNSEMCLTAFKKINHGFIIVKML